MKRLPAAAALLLFLSFAAAAPASEGPSETPKAGHGGMHGTHGEGGGAEDHGKMGFKIYGGPIGPWSAEARLVDMKAEMVKAKISEKVMAKMPAGHHLMLFVTDPRTQEPVAGIKGKVTVTGPDKTMEKKDLVVMGGHIGADVTLDKPGKYEFAVEVESAEKKGAARFITVK